MTRTPNYKLLKEYEGIPVGTFLRPVELRWIPKEVVDSIGIAAKMIDEKKEVICYSSYGMKIIPRELIEEA